LINYIQSDKYLITNHARQRMVDRGITNKALEEGIINGEIIEQYPNDKPCPSVLVLTKGTGDPLHLFIGVCTDHIRIITCYYPDKYEWIENRTRRKP